MNNLARTLRAQGDHAGARTIQEEVLAIRCRVLGAEHPDTLISMNNLASTLNGLRAIMSARGTIQEEVLAVMPPGAGSESIPLR